jgi:hypothetical protein
MDDRSAVLVTIHGIGFQQPPEDGRPGYADALHERLRTELGDLLGDDPQRPEGGPVYVRSEVDGSRDKGLGRLAPNQPLVKRAGTIAHVALVYSPSEPLDSRLGSVADAIARAALAHGHYTTVLGALRLVLGDAWAALHETTGGAEVTSSLLPRSDPPLKHASHGWLHGLLHGHADPAAPLPPPDPGALGMLRALEDDVATYVARNDLRERVRGFVQAALLMLCDRAEDVDALVVNGHSQGTVLSWDVLCRLPFFSWQATDPRRAGLLRHYVTAGSPIRKYVDMFAWGDQVGQLAAVFDDRPGAPGWSNFWDPKDPVADPLDPPTAWHFGDPTDMPRPDGDLGLLLRRDPAGGPSQHVAIADVPVDNIHNSAGGGLQAHDYWNNQTQFVAPLAQILRGAI